VPSELELAGRIGIALLLSGLIGLEREITDQTAGLRTHISVALGACLFAIVSAYAFDAFNVPRDDTVFQVDVTRVASNIVTGVGFLGGGAIVKYGASVKGLTTAASMWVTAAVGLAVGLGEYTIATVTTFALLLSLVGLRAPRKWLHSRVGIRKQTLVIKPARSQDIGNIVGFLHEASGIDVHSLTIRKEEGEAFITVDLRTTDGGDVKACISELSSRDDVHDISYAD
jgi:putative Mg2+ transporter-C (MgtC) family protein